MNIDYKNNLNAEQYQAVTNTEGPILLIAGAGAGKTRTLIYRLSYMIENGILPENILLLTFTNAAANEMIKRAKELLDDRCEKVTACTYHSFCANMLRKYAKIIGLNSNFTILSPSQVNDALDFVKATYDNRFKLKGFPRSSIIAGIYSTNINTRKSIEDIVEDKYNKYKNYINEIKELIGLYITYKKEQDLMDYDDLLTYFNQLLDNDDINRQIEGRYKYIMIDEYQDTNNLQEEIIIKLRKFYNNIAVVGDDYQSIYSFRGSNVNNFISFPKKFPGCKEIFLMTNYRSTYKILDLANKVMEKNAHFGIPKNMSSGKIYNNPDEPVLWVGGSQIDQNEFVEREIKKLVSYGVNYNDIAILERSSMSSNKLEVDITTKNIPFIKRGGLKFLEHRCILDVIAYLNALVNPKDVLSWFRILKLHPDIGDIFARKLADLASKDYDNLLKNPYVKRKFYPELIILHDFLRNNKSKTNFIEQFDAIKEFYYNLRRRTIEIANLEFEDTRIELLEQLEQEKELLNELRLIIAKYPSATKFLDAIVLDSVSPKENGGELTISTIHSAKGLEWDYVFLLDAIDDSENNISSNWYTEEDNEELRCFYVAITRARKKIYICSPRSGFLHGKFTIFDTTHYLYDKSDEIINLLQIDPADASVFQN